MGLYRFSGQHFLEKSAQKINNYIFAHFLEKSAQKINNYIFAYLIVFFIL
jgi:hypothetical protein